VYTILCENVKMCNNNMYCCEKYEIESNNMKRKINNINNNIIICVCVIMSALCIYLYNNNM